MKRFKFSEEWKTILAIILACAVYCYASNEDYKEYCIANGIIETEE